VDKVLQGVLDKMLLGHQAVVVVVQVQWVEMLQHLLAVTVAQEHQVALAEQR
jgi:hypothetical protein